MNRTKEWKRIQGKRTAKSAVLLSLGMALLLTACGSSYSKTDSAMTPMAPVSNGGMAEAAYDEAWSEAEVGFDKGEYPAQYTSEVVDNSAYYESRKLIRTVHLDAETKEFDQMVAALEARVAELGGYIENMSTYNGSSYSYRSSARSASMTARIPKQQLNVFLDTVAQVGNVVSRSESVEDVTLSYVDMESRKEALKIEQERLLELLAIAENLEDMLIIEERLTDVRYQMERMESQLRTYDNKVDFATIYLNISEVEELTPVVEETVWERISHGFMDSLRSIGSSLVDFFVWFLVSLPYLVIWAVIIAVIVLVIRLWIRGRRKKKAKRLEQAQQAAQAQQAVQDQQAGNPEVKQ